MDYRLKRYQKEFPYSYAEGVYTCIELLNTHPEQVVRLLLSSSGTRNGGIGRIVEMCSRQGIPFETNDRLIQRICCNGKHLAVGVFNKYPSAIEPDKNHLVLVNPSDMGNTGTIARTMAGFGVFNLALIRPAPDHFDPRVIRSSMGSIFRLNIGCFETLQDYHGSFANNNLYLFRSKKGRSIKKTGFVRPFSLVFGNESSGLPDNIDISGTIVSIPQKSNIDSLNLSVAAGIALYEGCR
ncbi:MAG: TrmH family RNA methyltransferase [Deltaproteobacteria bacterium]|jgi:TrmH family RNA methyltransferase|nr:TrmH family RNA methyltransferase [Deltaproteobacteria bacterium]